MALKLHALADLAALDADTVIDVRSPSEFSEDRLPGAISLPVLDDAERAQVGTIYKQESPFKARRIGAALVARNAARHIETVLADRGGGWRPLVYCWRGGQRSGAFAAILKQIGWRTQTLDGGYRSYRRLVVEALYHQPWPGRLVVLDGNTGTAKTDVLVRLSDRGHQVIDLEGLARHRGSVLGVRAGPQPSQKAFESGIALALTGFDPGRPVLVEAESSKVGDLSVPPSLWSAMQAAPRIVVEAPASARAAYLARAYADLCEMPETALARFDLLVPFHGRAQIDIWKARLLAGEGAEDTARDLIELHYDPRYARSRARSSGRRAAVLKAGTLDAAGINDLAAAVAEALETIG